MQWLYSNDPFKQGRIYQISCIFNRHTRKHSPSKLQLQYIPKLTYMKNFLLAAVLFLTGYDLTAQAPKTSLAQDLKKVLTLKMPKTVNDSMPGTRGASVAWHPEQKKYYAAFAGNTVFPQAVFDNNGNRLSADNQTCFIDTRGLWYDPAKKIIMGNGYSDNGWFGYILNSKGIVVSHEIIVKGMNQPGIQSVGAYNTTAKQVLFLNNSLVYSYSEEGKRKDSVLIHWGRTKAMGPGNYEDANESHEDYNFTTVIYTDITGSELGFLNTLDNLIELYDIKSGFLTKVLLLPDESPAAQPSFNFAYSNGIYWIFDKERREWLGYQ
jgi:hypothetical protein